MIKRKMTSSSSGWGLKHTVLQDIETYEKETGDKLESREDIIQYLFGSSNQRAETNLDIYIMFPPENSWVHRLNMFWAAPLTLLCSPFLFVKYGSIGWTNKTMLGKFILKSVGQDS